MADMTEREYKELMELRAKVGVMRQEYNQVKENIPLPDLLIRALECAERERAMEKDLNNLREEFEKTMEVTANAWNDYHRALMVYIENGITQGMHKSEVMRVVENNKPVMAGVPKGY